MIKKIHRDISEISLSRLLPYVFLVACMFGVFFFKTAINSNRFVPVSIYISITLIGVITFLFFELFDEYKTKRFLSGLGLTCFFLTAYFVSVSLLILTPETEKIGRLISNHCCSNGFDEKYISAILYIICTAIWEEIIFRKLLFSFLLKQTNSILKSVIICAFIFGILHGPDFFSVFIGGILYSFLYARYRSLLLVIILHFFSNFVIYETKEFLHVVISPADSMASVGSTVRGLFVIMENLFLLTLITIHIVSNRHRVKV